MKELLFLQPTFQERIWGGRALETQFNYDIPAGAIGECWGISAHANGQSIVKNGPYSGQTLGAVYQVADEIFGANRSEIFPLLVKILDANADLSVQVHPDDGYAAVHEAGELGKTECWYVLDAQPDAKIIFGHHAQSLEEMKQMIEADDWEGLLRVVPVKKGDFFYVPSGTIHALCAGTLILEVQQSSDTTYRLYDYHRLDDAGNLRELHIEKSLAVSTIPHTQDDEETVVLHVDEQMKVMRLVGNGFFTVYRYDVITKGRLLHDLDKYALVSVVSGAGVFAGQAVKKGDHFIVPVDFGEAHFEGTFEMIVAHI